MSEATEYHEINETNDEEIIDVFDDKDFTGVKNIYEAIKNVEKTTIPVLTKYERAKIIGVRSQQLADGAIPLIKVPDEITSVDKIAYLELKARKIPLIVRRWLSETPKIYEDWKIEEFEIIDI